MTLYAVFKYTNLEIRTLEVERVTEHWAFLANGRREKLHTEWIRWFQTKEDAIEDYRLKLVRELERAERRVTDAKNALTAFSDFAIRETAK